MPSVYWISEPAQFRLSPIFGFNRVNLHAIINDHSGDLQRRAFIYYKHVAALVRQHKAELDKEKQEYLEDLIRQYVENQGYMLRHGLDPGQKPL